MELDQAIKYDNIFKAIELINNGCDIEFRNYNDETPLMVAYKYRRCLFF